MYREVAMVTKKGQSTVDYLIMFAVVVAAILAVANSLNSKVESSLNSATDKMVTQVSKINFGN